MNRDAFIKAIKDSGQSIIDNAENIYNSFDYPSNGVEITVVVDSHSVPRITVMKQYIPEGFILPARKGDSVALTR